MTSMENNSGKGGVKQTVVGLEKRKDLSVCMSTGRRGFWYEAGRKNIRVWKYAICSKNGSGNKQVTSDRLRALPQERFIPEE